MTVYAVKQLESAALGRRSPDAIISAHVGASMTPAKYPAQESPHSSTTMIATLPRLREVRRSGMLSPSDSQISAARDPDSDVILRDLASLSTKSRES